MSQYANIPVLSGANQNLRPFDQGIGRGCRPDFTWNEIRIRNPPRRSDAIYDPRFGCYINRYNVFPYVYRVDCGHRRCHHRRFKNFN